MNACKCLIKAWSQTHVDAKEDELCYKRNDVVVVVDLDHEWGGREGMPDFYRVVVLGKTKEEMTAYIAPKMSPLKDLNTGEFEAMVRREFTVDVDETPLPVPDAAHAPAEVLAAYAAEGITPSLERGAEVILLWDDISQQFKIK